MVRVYILDKYLKFSKNLVKATVNPLLKLVSAKASQSVILILAISFNRWQGLENIIVL